MGAWILEECAYVGSGVAPLSQRHAVCAPLACRGKVGHGAGALRLVPISSFCLRSTKSSHDCSSRKASRRLGASPACPVMMAQSGDGGGIRSRLGIAVGLVLIVSVLLAPTLIPLIDQKAPLSDASVDQRLKQVPVFSVTDSAGKPYLAESEDRTRAGSFFLDPKDAERFLGRVRDLNGASSDVQIFPISLGNALQFVRRKDVNSDRFRLRAADADIQLARKLSGGSFKGDVPLFYVDGLAFANNDNQQQTVIPLFFHKEDLDTTITMLKKQNPSMASELLNKLSIIDLNDALEDMRSGQNPNLKKVIFYPSSNAVQYLKALKAAEGTKSIPAAPSSR